MDCIGRAGCFADPDHPTLLLFWQSKTRLVVLFQFGRGVEALAQLLAPMTTSETAARAGNRTTERTSDAPVAADTMIAAAQRNAFAMRFFRFMVCSLVEKFSLGSFNIGGSFD
jgi:hypothetical protein